MRVSEHFPVFVYPKILHDFFKGALGTGKSVSDTFVGRMSRVVRKPDFCLCETKPQISCAQLISTLYLFFINQKFQASSHLL